ncbi:hypothetical protein PLESTM_000773200 [Pleodorina starrii]|nr:hypothetical protein PLESTM_000773200 [Pleodorina starrii]
MLAAELIPFQNSAITRGISVGFDVTEPSAFRSAAIRRHAAGGRSWRVMVGDGRSPSRSHAWRVRLAAPAADFMALAAASALVLMTSGAALVSPCSKRAMAAAAAAAAAVAASDSTNCRSRASLFSRSIEMRSTFLNRGHHSNSWCWLSGADACCSCSQSFSCWRRSSKSRK